MPLTLPVLISEGFGTGDASKTYPIPVPSQIGITPGAASFADGFPPLTRTALGAGGIPPNGEDVNGILYMLSAHMALINSGQPYLYDAGQATAIGGYGVGAVLQNATHDGFWLCTTDGNTTNPDTGGAGWVPLSGLGETVVTLSSGTVNLTAAQAAKPLIAFDGALTGNVTVNFPENVGQSWTVAAYTSGAYTITLQTAAAGNSVLLPSGSGYSNAQNVFVDNGGNLWSNNVSTAGLAPINNPALTGVPTAPTAGASSNTTQIATTAFSQAAIAAAIAGLAPKASPTLTGSPTAPTPAPGNNSALLATTAFVQAAISAIDFTATLALNGKLSFPVPGGLTLTLQWGIVAQSGGGEISGQVSALPFANTHATLFVICMANGGTPMFVQTWTPTTFTWGTGYTGGLGASLIRVLAIGY